VTVLVPEALFALASRSASPERVAIALTRLSSESPGAVAMMTELGRPTDAGRAFVAVVAASDSLGRFCLTEPAAIAVLADLDGEVATGWDDERSLALTHRLALLRTAARDLLGRDPFDVVVRSLSDSASRLLEGAIELAGPGAAADLAVIGMGKLGGRELNYASDIDVMFVADASGAEDPARRVMGIARSSIPVDADLRPEGRAGPLVRTLDSYRAYWARWAETWEFQALIKARPVAGDTELGARFSEAAETEVWDRSYSSDEIALIRRLKERSEAIISGRGLNDRELKRAPGGIRDVEFAVQLLQLVHGRRDPTIRSKTTLDALKELADSGYVGVDQAESLGNAYRFLRTVEHRLQLVEEQQTHTVPARHDARERLARVLGFGDDPGSTATAQFDEALRTCRTEVRSLHEQLFFRPLLEAFAELPVSSGTLEGARSAMSADQVSDRLRAFGFAGAARTKAAVDELAQGLTRSSRLMGQMLPLLLDWLSVTPDPDLGLLGLRNLLLHPHRRSRLVTIFRESPEAARRLCLLLGSSRTLGEAVGRNPELMARLGYDDALAVSPRSQLQHEVSDRLLRRGASSDIRSRLMRFHEEQLVRVAARDLLDLDDFSSTEAALSAVAEVILDASVGLAEPEVAFSVIALGRLGGGELSYASDLDLMFVHGGSGEIDAGHGEAVAERLLRLVQGPSPSERLYSVDLRIRPEGGQGRLSRDLAGYALYFERWAQTWERQALLRARVVAGNRELGDQLLEIAVEFVRGPLGDENVAEIRRMKARVERERIPAGEDPQFHLKLGKGSLSDVEWTVQLLQLRHRVPGTGTMATLSRLERDGIVNLGDATALREAYEFCDRTRNRWHLVGALPGGGSPGDSLPTQAHQLSRLARSLYTTPTILREDYRRLTRRCRRVMERLFYGIDEPRAS
jgi:[glutamine synthetase] adenylyltransferase / [glutamine synthetase]-adenylyl-L-tyrosine phosphorylase